MCTQLSWKLLTPYAKIQFQTALVMELRKLSSEEAIDLINDLFWQSIRAFEGEVGDVPFIAMLLITEDTINLVVESAILFS